MLTFRASPRLLFHRLCAVFFFAFLAFHVAPKPIVDTDTSWHLAAGVTFLEQFEVKKENYFSFSYPHAEWINLSWGWDVLIAQIWQWGGAKGLWIFSTTLYAALFAFIAYSLLLLPGGSAGARLVIRWPALCIVLAAVCCVFMHVQYARPHYATLLGMVLSYHLLSRHRICGGFSYIRWLPVVMLFWVNLHGGVIAGFVAIAAFLAESYFDSRPVRWRPLALVTFCCVLALCVNPYGWKVFHGIFLTLGGGITPYMQEWEPYQFNHYVGVDAFLCLVVLSGCLAMHKAPWAEKLLAAFWLLAALYAVRNFMNFAVAAAPLLTITLSRFSHRMQSSSSLPAWISFNGVNTLVVALIITVIPFHKWLGVALEMDERIVATQEVNYLKVHHPNAVVMNHPNFGGTMIIQGVKPFVDPRNATAYPEDFMQEVAAIFFNGDAQAFNRAVEAYKINAILTPRAHFMAQKYRLEETGWKHVYTGPAAMVFVRIE